jgi:hypothetical protein
VKRRRLGYASGVDEPRTASPRAHDDKTGSGGPQVTSELRRDTVVVMVVGKLIEPARRPLVRSMTDLLLNVASLRRSLGTSPPPG